MYAQSLKNATECRDNEYENNFKMLGRIYRKFVRIPEKKFLFYAFIVEKRLYIYIYCKVLIKFYCAFQYFEQWITCFFLLLLELNIGSM